MEIKDFQTRQSWGEAQQLLLAAGVILRIAFGELASTNALVSKQVFSETESKKADKAFRDIMKYMGKSADAYRAKCIEYDKDKSKEVSKVS